MSRHNIHTYPLDNRSGTHLLGRATMTHSYSAKAIGTNGLRYEGTVIAANTEEVERIMAEQIGAPLRYQSIRRTARTAPGTVAHQAAAASQSLEAARHAASQRPGRIARAINAVTRPAPLTEVDTALGELDSQLEQQEHRHDWPQRILAGRWALAAVLVGALTWLCLGLIAGYLLGLSDAAAEHRTEQQRPTSTHTSKVTT